ncbi:hypothetical protein GCM10025876_19420 [Demequina litorisediminis]|uniref:NAD-specific glutamate dehydrogenase n=1 Tax=Demequina litorisediminis TaxID=1849022 RepID=A0ABQ6ID17_9MICO|nr:hypothetical protein GCM10025876_19420 [Demequina litorisediminis]
MTSSSLVERLHVAAQDVGLAFGLAQTVRGASLDDLDLVGDPVAHERVEREGARHAVDQGDHVGAEGLLQLRVLVEVVEHHLRHSVALEHDHEALAGAARGLVTNVRDAGYLAVLHQFGDLQRKVVRVHLVRQRRDHEALAALDLLDVDDGTHRDGATSRAVRLVDALAAKDERAGGEVGSLDALDQRLEEFLARGRRVLERPLDTSGNLAQVVRRDVGRHTDSDTGRAVDEEVREARGEHLGLLRLAVIVVLEIDGFLVDVADHLHGDGRHASLGVTVRGGRVVTGGTEVALARGEGVAQGPVLHHADEGVVDSRVTVRVVVTHHLADDAGALGERAVGTVAAVVHRVHDATVDGLQSVTDIGQCAPDDDGHGVVEVRLLHLHIEIDLVDPAVVVDLRCQGTSRPSRCAG